MDFEALRRMPNCLRKYRRIAGFSQKQVAKKLGLNNSSEISRWENGMRFPSLKNFLRLSILYWALPEALYIDHVRELRKQINEREERYLLKKSDA